MLLPPLFGGSCAREGACHITGGEDGFHKIHQRGERRMIGGMESMMQESKRLRE